jgi:folate-binding protein YgfZ
MTTSSSRDVNPDDVVVDQSDWGQIVVTGADRGRFLQGLLTADVQKLTPGAWCRAAMLSVKGRVLALADVVHEGERFVLITAPETAEKLAALLDRHAIADDVAFAREARPLHRVWPNAEAVWTAPPVWSARTPSPPALIEARRIEAGLPRYGVDVGEDHFPFEANLERAVSFQKGCYAGQEVVVRATTQGQVKKKLVGLTVPVSASADPEGRAAMAASLPGQPIHAEGREAAGQVTSAAVSPRLGVIALAYLHRSLWTPGQAVSVAGHTALVAPLPFPDPSPGPGGAAKNDR